MQAWQDDIEAQEQLKLAVQSTLGLLFFKRVEVPTIALFHKEVLGELLATRRFEIPHTVTVRALPRPTPLSLGQLSHRKRVDWLCQRICGKQGQLALLSQDPGSLRSMCEHEWLLIYRLPARMMPQ